MHADSNFDTILTLINTQTKQNLFNKWNSFVEKNIEKNKILDSIKFYVTIFNNILQQNHYMRVKFKGKVPTAVKSKIQTHLPILVALRRLRNIAVRSVHRNSCRQIGLGFVEESSWCRARSIAWQPENPHKI